MAGDPDVLNSLGAADYLGVHVETLRRLARRNEIPSFKIGRDWRFRKEVLLRWADKQRSGDCNGSIVVIDDEEKICRAHAEMVENFGCHARRATSGAEGLQLIAQQVPDVILLDLRMPDMNGPQFLAELRKTHPALPVVLIAGYSESDLMKQAMRYAPLMLLAKPAEPTKLERTIRMVLGERLAVRCEE